jgi:hypothetical protein
MPISNFPPNISGIGCSAILPFSNSLKKISNLTLLSESLVAPIDHIQPKIVAH